MGWGWEGRGKVRQSLSVGCRCLGCYLGRVPCHSDRGRDGLGWVERGKERSIRNQHNSASSRRIWPRFRLSHLKMDMLNVECSRKATLGSGR